MSKDYGLLSEPLSTCFITLEVGNKHIPLKGRITAITDTGLWISYEWDKKLYSFVHGFTKNGETIIRNEKTKFNRPHFLLPYGSAADVDWATGQPTANEAIISALTRSKLVVDAIKAISSSKSGFNLKMVIIIGAVLIIGAIIVYSVMGNMNKDKTPTPTIPITNIIPQGK